MSEPSPAHVRWLTVFVDLAAEHFDADTRFWQDVTSSTRSPLRGPDGAFATLLPAKGSPYVRVQRTDDGSCGVHLDLHVDSIDESRQVAQSLGATLVADRGFAVMASPGGFVFCLVSHEGEEDVPEPIETTAANGSALPNRLDQLSIDIPHGLFDRETAFWAALTAWELRTGSRPEFGFLVRPVGLPLRLLFHRLGAEDSGRVARGHLDLACGDSVDQLAEIHERSGAVTSRIERYWTTMVDPAGLPYCLTRRDPMAGLLPD